MRFLPFGWFHKSSRRNRQTEVLTEFKPVTTLPEEAQIREEDIPWAIIIEEQPGAEVSRTARPPARRLEGVPPMPVLIILPILIALLAFAVSE